MLTITLPMWFMYCKHWTSQYKLKLETSPYVVINYTGLYYTIPVQRFIFLYESELTEMNQNIDYKYHTIYCVYCMLTITLIYVISIFVLSKARFNQSLSISITISMNCALQSSRSSDDTFLFVSYNNMKIIIYSVTEAHFVGKTKKNQKLMNVIDVYYY